VSLRTNRDQTENLAPRYASPYLQLDFFPVQVYRSDLEVDACKQKFPLVNLAGAKERTV
jgi:hypothetical protein